MDAKALGRRQPAHRITPMVTMTAMLFALATPMQQASANESSGIFRCTGEGRQDAVFQQTPCSDSGIFLEARDSRSDEQRRQARLVAQREQDIAVTMAYTRQVDERHALAETSRARALTVVKKPRVSASNAVPTTLIPKKRDFRAASPKVVKTRTAKSKPQRPHSAQLKADAPGVAG